MDLMNALANHLAAMACPIPVDVEMPRPGVPYHKPNGGTRSGAAAAKRAARTRRNIRKNRRGTR